MNFINFILNRHSQILHLLLEHMRIAVASVLLAICIGLPIAILMSRYKNTSKLIMTIINAMQAIPSLAVLGFLIPFIGVSEKTAIIMIVIYAILPIVKNAFTGLDNISQEINESAMAMGMTHLQKLFKVELPLALPVIMAGIRISAVNAVGLTTIASYAGGKGLGFLVYSGINTVDTNMILAGAFPAALLALTMDFAVGCVEKVIISPGIK